MPGTISYGIPCCCEPRGFLAAAPEDERIAALQPHHAPTAAGMVHEQAVDPLLRRAVAAGRLADVDDLGFAAGPREDFRADEAVRQDHVGRLQRAQCPQRQQFRIAGARAHQRYESARRLFVHLQRLLEQALRVRLVPGAHGLRDGSVEQPLVERAACRDVFPSLPDRRAPALGETREAAPGGVEHRLEARAHGGREHGRDAAG